MQNYYVFRNLEKTSKSLLYISLFALNV